MITPESIDTATVTPLTQWSVASTPPGTITNPEDDALSGLDWMEATDAGTVAAALVQNGRWRDEPDVNLDGHDWWFRTTFSADTHPAPTAIRFGGLATVAEVWLNGAEILTSENMFLEHRVNITPRDGLNQLVIRFASVDAWLKKRRPRGRWRTRLVGQQQLRWLRTSLLGRVRAWMPPAAPVGPWRPVELIAGVGASIRDVDVGATVVASEGRVTVRAELDGDVHGARLVVGEHRATLGVTSRGGTTHVLGELAIPSPTLWWPHTHGTQHQYPTRIEIDVDGHTTALTLPPVSFRTTDAVVDGPDFQLLINGEPIFCRGACWTHLDIIGLTEDAALCRKVLTLVRTGGMNMLRVVGTATYESEMFYRLCDELGILVWQDFPFANMDYPGDDKKFCRSVTEEATQNLNRLKRHPSLVVLCGGSEIFQQAGMMGLEKESWTNPIFEELLPNAVKSARCNIPYVASSPMGGALPFHNGSGISHYFGVGAYRQPLSDLRRSDVRFTTECLGFSNVPELPTVDATASGGLVHSPAWKAGVPRDAGAGWDFEDVRDHYFRELFDVDPVAFRFRDPEYYLALSAVVSGEVMTRAFAEWRRGGSSCNGALVWFLRDLRVGAGWGLIDARNLPKAPYWFLRRALAPISVLLTEEGMDGLRAHVVNETRQDRQARLEVRLVRTSGVPVAAESIEVQLPAQSTVVADVDAVLGRFTDVSWVYRFGPRNHDVVAVTVFEGTEMVSEAFHFLTPLVERADHDLLSATAVANGDEMVVTVTSTEVARAVYLELEGWEPSDNYFTLMPDRPRSITVRSVDDSTPFRGYVNALNAPGPVRISLDD